MIRTFGSTGSPHAIPTSQKYSCKRYRTGGRSNYGSRKVFASPECSGIITTGPDPERAARGQSGGAAASDTARENESVPVVVLVRSRLLDLAIDGRPSFVHALLPEPPDHAHVGEPVQNPRRFGSFQT